MNLYCKTLLYSLGIFSFGFAAITPTEVSDLPMDVVYGGSDKVGSSLISSTYNAGNGPGIWIVADGGFRLYVNGELLAEDNQAGRVTFVPYTFLPGENAVSVVSSNKQNKGGVLVQIDELEKTYYSGDGWKAKPYVSNNSWKEKNRDLSQWGSASSYSTAANAMPSGGSLAGFPNEGAKWIWTDNQYDTLAVLLYTFNIKAEGYGINTTGGSAGKIVVAKDSSSIRKYLQSTDALTILVPEGTYDFRLPRDAATYAASKGRAWCKMSCTEKNAQTGKTNQFYRASFKGDCSDLSESTTKVKVGEIQDWSNWITTRANKSLIGMGRGANLRGASIAIRSNENSYNHIYRNLAIYDVNPHLIEGGDGLETVGTSSKHVNGFWADHISYKWISDGMDMEFVDNATISYTDLDGANEYNCWGTDPYMALVEDAKLTYANNYWHQTYGRVPKVTGEVSGSTVHLYNQYVDYNRFFVVGANGHSSTAKAYVLYENSYINNGQGYLAEWGDNGYVYFSGVTLNNTKSQHRYNGTVQSGIPSATSFKPDYSYIKRPVTNLPTEIPKIVGVGGKWGSMPAYNQAFKISPEASSVVLSSLVELNTVDLSATVNSSSGAAIKKVDFYVGTTLVGSSTTEPYSVRVSDLPAGIYSARAEATDANSLKGVSLYSTFTVQAEALSSSSEEEISSSSESSLAVFKMNENSTELADSFRVFDLQGNLLYKGSVLPKERLGQTITVEYNAHGKILRKYKTR